MLDELKNEASMNNYTENFDKVLPRTLFAEVAENRDKEGSSSFTGTINTSAFLGMQSSANILRNPSRRFYDPEITTTAIYLPKDIKRNNRWCRWFYDHDEMVGAVLDVHAELPYSRFKMKVDDPVILRHIEECIERTNFFSMLPLIDLEYMKIGEVFINNHWNTADGMWDSIVIHNPDYLEVKYSPFADKDPVIELTPDEELRTLVHSTRPEDQRLKRRLPQDLVKRILTGRNIILDPREVTHIARRSNPYDLRGTSIVRRLFRLLQYEDKLRECQITIADNFVYPLKIFKLGDESKGWIPNASHQKALAQMLQQANFDPNFSLIYHYGLKVDVITVADKLMRLDQEWTEINRKKCMALGVSEEFLTKGENFAAANVGLQTQLARYRAKRDLFEIKWIRDKFFRIMAENNQWYKRDAREIVGQFRVKRKGDELKKRLIIPEIIWDKKLALRDDQQYLTFLNNVYAQGKGPVSVLTLLVAMGLSLDEELANREKQKELEQKFGITISPPPSQSAPAGMPPLGGIASKVLDKIKFGKNKTTLDKNASLSEEKTEDAEIKPDGEFVKPDSIDNYSKYTEEDENKYAVEVSKDIYTISDKQWKDSLKSKNIPKEVVTLLVSLDETTDSIQKKSNGNFSSVLASSPDELVKILTNLYIQGKLLSYDTTNFLPVYRNVYSSEIKDFSDLVLIEEFKSWIDFIAKSEMSKSDIIGNIKTLGNTCFSYGQLKGYQEQGINKVKLSNVLENDGLCYNIKDLLGKRNNLASMISPNGDIAIFYSCIEGFDEEDSSIDPHIVRNKDFIYSGIKVNNCPIDFVKPVTKYLEKVGRVFKKSYDAINFVTDVVDSEEWEKTIRNQFDKEYAHLKDEDKSLSVSAAISYERLKKRGNLAIFNNKREIYVSNWLGLGDRSLVTGLIKSIDIYSETLDKSIEKLFDKKAYDLSRDELDIYRVFGYIEPMFDSNSEITGWNFVDKIVDGSVNVVEKLKLGKIWNSDGVCVNNNIEKDPRMFFFDNLKLWIEYPHKLDEATVSNFNKLF